MVTLSQMPPHLSEDGTRMDWPLARYCSSVNVWTGGASVTNELTDAPALQTAVLENRACWALEVRSPKVVYAVTHMRREESFDVSWNPADTDRRLYLTPGLVATEEFQIPTSDLVHGIWDTGAVTVPKGWWLVKGNTHASESLSMSLLTFKLAEGLESGRMQVVADTSSGDLRFIVNLAPDLFERIRTSRDVQVAGLIAVCGLFPKYAATDDSDESSEQGQVVLSSVKNYLLNAGVPTWDNDDYDPASAATAIERFLRHD